MSLRVKKTRTNTTRKNMGITKLKKCPRSRRTGMESFKISCGKNLLLGYHTIKGAEETSTDKDDFVNVSLAKLSEYNKPVVVKAYDVKNFHLPLERRILERITGFRNTAKLICDFECDDDKQRYVDKMRTQMKFCGVGNDKLHFFVYEYIAHGDISDYLKTITDYDTIKHLILQLACVIIELESIYHIYHNDLNSGNLLIDTYAEDTIEYCIDGEPVYIPSHGIMPKLIDYGRSNFYDNRSGTNIWFDVIMILGVVHRYIRNEQYEKRLTAIAETVDMVLPRRMDYYNYLAGNL